MNQYKLPFLASLLAIAITATMDFTGFTVFSALPLLLLTLLFWIILKLTKEEIGLKSGIVKYYGLALLYPALVLGFLALSAFLAGDFSLEKMSVANLSKNIMAGCTIGVIMVLLTEEGFFRGLMWGAFRKKGMDARTTLFVTTAIFTIWHISAVTSDSEYGLPLWQVPIYLINVGLLGLIWGLLRSISGSVVVASVSHAVWNAFAYELFGYGEKVGALGITNTALFGPEVGVLGILLNGAFFFWLWGKAKKKNSL